MAGRISDADLEQVRARSPIEEIVGEHVQLRSGGGDSLKGLCPFHDEKSPSFNVTPSRGLWYCLAGETRVITDRGTRPISDLVGGTHRVLGRSGNWVEAPFRSFGRQPLMRITLGRNRQRKEIYATPEHRWFVRSGKTPSSEREVVTRSLRPGHRLVSTYPRSHIRDTTPSPFGIAHGFTYGDGTRTYDGSMAMLDVEKEADLLKWFPCSRTSVHGRQLVVHHLPAFFTELPPLQESTSYLYGWLAGYVAADGCVAADGTVMLTSADREALEFVRAVCTRLGIGTYGITEQMREGFPGREPSPLYRVHFVNDDLTDDFFLLEQHRSRFAGAEKKFARRGWVVRSVEETGRFEEVYCAVVDDGHAFTLEDNILTGNCFGCGEGGDVISFLQKLDGLTFAEAVEHLADRAGIQLRYEQGGYVPGQDRSKRARLIDAHRAAARFYAEQLTSPEAVEGRRYLAERGFDQAAADRFGVGYAPPGWESLVRHLRGRGFADAELIAAGLAKEGRRGPMDRFRNRLVWPIHDLSGDIIGFGARRLADDDGAKYLNTPETALFHKGAVLYGANLARKAIMNGGRAVIVEGYTDVMACHLAGVECAVATCGTAFGEDHIKLLRRLLLDAGNPRAEVIFTFDGDAAGQRAAMRAFAEDQRFVAQTFVAVQRDGLDPCELRQARGDQAVADLVESRQPMFAFAIREVLGRYALDTPESQLAALDAAAPIVASIRNEGLRRRYAINLDRWLGLMDERFVLQEVARAARAARRDAGRDRRGTEHGGSGGRDHARRGTERDGDDVRRGADRPTETARPAQAGQRTARLGPAGQVEREALMLAVQRPELLGAAFDALPMELFTVPEHVAVRSLITAEGGVTAAGRDWSRRLLERATDPQVRDLINRLAVAQLKSPEEPDVGYAAAQLGRLREFHAERTAKLLMSRLNRLDPAADTDEYNALTVELLRVEQERRAAKEQATRTL